MNPRHSRIAAPALGEHPPLGGSPDAVQAWFEHESSRIVPAPDGTLERDREAAKAFAQDAKARNTRLAYRAGVRAWCAYCRQHDLACLPATAADIAAFLAAERGRLLKASTVTLRQAALAYLHALAGCATPTDDPAVTATLSGIRRRAAQAGEQPAKKLAATLAIMTDILDLVGDDLVGLRDRALLLLGFAGALRRAELAAARVEHLSFVPQGATLLLPVSKGDPSAAGTLVPLPAGSGPLCPVAALQRWCASAKVTEGPLFRRIWLRPAADTRGPDRFAGFRVGNEAIHPLTVARIVKSRAAAAGHDPDKLGGHSLKRGIMTEGEQQQISATRLKLLGHHRSYGMLAGYLEHPDPFADHPLQGLI